MFNPDAEENKSTFKVTPPGRYIGYFKTMELGRSKSSGNPMLTGHAILLSTEDGAHSGEEKFVYIPMEPHGDTVKSPRLGSLARAIQTGPFNPLDQRQVTEKLCYQPFSVDVRNKTEVYNGEKRIRADLAFFNPITDADRDLLCSCYGEYLVPLPEEGDPTYDTTTYDETSSQTEDEIPY